MTNDNGEDSELQEKKLLEDLLEETKEGYNHLRSDGHVYDLTETFRRTRRHGKYRSPKVFGDVGRKNAVVGFILYGKDGVPSFIDKYKAESTELKEFSKEAMFLSSAYIPGVLENTTLREVSSQGIDGIQGFSRSVLERIVNCLKKETGHFNSESDSVFMVAGPKEEAVAKAQLISKWYIQAARHGKEATHIMDEEEARMMESAIGLETLTKLVKTPYPDFPMYRNWEPSPVSRAFVHAKIRAYEEKKKGTQA